MLEAALSHLIMQEFNYLQRPPASTLLILLVSALISLVTALANRKVMNLEEYRRLTIQSHEVRRELMEAMRSGSQRRIAKAQKQQQEMMKAQQKMMMDRMKITLFFIIPFILIWQALVNFFKGVVAYMPFDAPFIGRELTVTHWYIICSISTNIIISRILGLTFEVEPAS
ncbi:DUF106 domain-containing protein [Candidatus Bathyarchaeota archaeon]|nr:DUF106 domain-containing protein [Candidatus Bathyarchaeota archaeon]